MAAEWVNELGVDSREAERDDAIEEGEARSLGVARAAQGFSRSLIVCTLRSIWHRLARAFESTRLGLGGEVRVRKSCYHWCHSDR